MSQELEEECERRVKAEKVASRLVEHVRSLQAQQEEGKREHEMTVVRVAKLDRELKTEREKRVGSEEEGGRVREALATARSELEAVRERLEEREAALREREAERRQREAGHTEEKMELVSLVSSDHCSVSTSGCAA